MTAPKIPESVLVVIHTPALEVLLLERADHPGFWQSVTGSRASAEEALVETAWREVAEETGFVRGFVPQGAELSDWRMTHRYAIYAHWRHRYAAGVTHNTEHVFGLSVAVARAPTLAAHEHRAWRWLPWRDAADACFSWTNAQAIRCLPERVARPAA